MSDIDPEKLEQAIKQASSYGGMHDGLAGGRYASVPSGALYALIDAARAHLATLPTWKDLAVERWGIYEQDGTYWASCNTEEEARALLAGHRENLVTVRLTGTAKVPA